MARGVVPHDCRARHVQHIQGPQGRRKWPVYTWVAGPVPRMAELSRRQGLLAAPGRVRSCGAVRLCRPLRRLPGVPSERDAAARDQRARQGGAHHAQLARGACHGGRGRRDDAPFRVGRAARGAQGEARVSLGHQRGARSVALRCFRREWRGRHVHDDPCGREHGRVVKLYLLELVSCPHMMAGEADPFGARASGLEGPPGWACQRI
mmetsp:Transcript_12504/g.30368  ORF Transcript_12504/g.30368 Transcript_12504/m.30368 type:complete len:207 (+) Transcript_12504:7111-7731(+)